MRPTELAFLELGQFRKITLNGTAAYIVKGKLRNINGTYKNSKGGIRKIEDASKEISILDIDQLDGKFNVYSHVDNTWR